MTDQLDLDRIPQHVAIIMDGNGRWATSRGQARTMGHREGVEAVRRAVKAADALGVRYLTVYGFSTENWSRPDQEVGFLMGLLKAYFGSRLSELIAGNVRIRVIGEISAFSQEVQLLLRKAVADSSENSGLQLIVALNYGGRDEIVRAAQRMATSGVAPDDWSAQILSDHMDAPDVPDPDLMIRTSGEQRLSNFLLWQLAYAEFYFADVHWPDFGAEHLEAAIVDFQSRKRRFGGLDDGSPRTNES